MRRYVRIGLSLLILAMLPAMTSCRPRVFTDGTYQAVSQGDDHGYAWAKVTIEKDKIKSVELKEITELGLEKDFATYPWPEAKQANEVMPGRFVQRNTWDVDGIAKATGSSDKYREAVKFALEKAKRRPTITTTYFDGKFMGKSTADTHGYGVAWVTVQTDRIADDLLDEVVVNEEGEQELKDWETYSYQPAVAARGEMTNRLKAASPATVANVDIVAGATSSSNKWKEAVQNALANAKVK